MLRRAASKQLGRGVNVPLTIRLRKNEKKLRGIQ
jgi:hypothetical protein